MATYKPLRSGSGFVAAVESTDTLATGVIANNSAVTTLAGSVSGNLHWSAPQQGSAWNKLVIVLVSFDDAGGGTITFPTAFTYAPAITSNTTGLTVVTMSTTSMTIPASNTSGVIIIEGI